MPCACTCPYGAEPPHQLLETSMCGVLTLNWVLSLLMHTDQPPSLTSLQQISNILSVTCLCLEATLKSYAYGPLGYISDRADAIDGLVTVLDVVGLFLGSFLPDVSSNLREFLAHSPSLFAMYRVLRLLTNWRFLRRLLQPTSPASTTTPCHVRSLIRAVACSESCR